MIVGIEQLFLSPLRENKAWPKPSPSLVELITGHGQLLPVIVRPADERRYEIVEHADVWRAVMLAGSHQVEILARDALTDLEVRELVNLEHLSDPITQARRAQRTLKTMKGSRSRGAAEALAAAYGISRSTLTHRLRLLKLSPELQEALRLGALTSGHAKALLGCRNPERRDRLAAVAIQERWSVRKTEAAVRSGAREGKEAPQRRSPDVERLEKDLSQSLGSPVHIDEHGGQLIIDYRKDPDVLDGILERWGFVG